MKVDYEPIDSKEQLYQEERALASGNRRLAFIVGALLLAGGVGLAVVPAQNRQRIANGELPTFQLSETSVVGAKPAAEADVRPATAAELPVKATSATKEAAAKAATAPEPKAAAATSVATHGAPQAAPEVATAPEPAEVAAPVAPTEEAAPHTVTLAGRVLDENGRPLIGATVFLKNSKKGTSTDANGNYTLEVPAGDNMLLYGYGGYEDQEMRIKGSQGGNVTLIPSENTGRRRRR